MTNTEKEKITELKSQGRGCYIEDRFGGGYRYV